MLYSEINDQSKSIENALDNKAEGSSMISFLEPELFGLLEIIVSLLLVNHFTLVNYWSKGLSIHWELESVCITVNTINPLVQVLRI